MSHFNLTQRSVINMCGAKKTNHSLNRETKSLENSTRKDNISVEASLDLSNMTSVRPNFQGKNYYALLAFVGILRV